MEDVQTGVKPKSESAGLSALPTQVNSGRDPGWTDWLAVQGVGDSSMDTWASGGW